MYLKLLEATRLVRLSRFILVACAVGAVTASSLADVRRVTLESRDHRQVYRRVDHDGYVRLSRRLSDKPCVQGRSWGYDRNGIWVSHGCRAVFEVGRDNRWDDRNGRDRWTGNGGIRVESEDGRYRARNVDTRGGVRLVRKLSDSPCIQGRTWGYDRNRIWVDRGCRAIFEVGRDNGRWDDRWDGRRTEHSSGLFASLL